MARCGFLFRSDNGHLKSSPNETQMRNEHADGAKLQTLLTDSANCRRCEVRGYRYPRASRAVLQKLSPDDLVVTVGVHVESVLTRDTIRFAGRSFNPALCYDTPHTNGAPIFLLLLNLFS